MARVFIPTLLRSLTHGRHEVEIEADNVAELIARLDQRFPGLADRLCEQDRLRPNISVAVDDEISPLGLLEELKPHSEVHFLTAIRGGASPE